MYDYYVPAIIHASLKIQIAAAAAAASLKSIIKIIIKKKASQKAHYTISIPIYILYETRSMRSTLFHYRS